MKGLNLHAIDPTAIISDSAVLGKNVTVGANVVIYDNVRIGDNSVIGPHSIIGEPVASFYSDADYQNPALVIGENSVIRSGAIIYCHSDLGDDLQLGHRVTIREGSRIGRHVRIGTLSDIQGFCTIGDYARLHSNVHVCQKSDIGKFVWLFPGTVLTNDPNPPSEQMLGPVIEDFAVVAVGVVVMPGVRIGRNSLIGANSLVRHDVEPGALVFGSPARKVGELEDFVSKAAGEPAYPWPEHFDRGMPWRGMGFRAWDEKRRSAHI